jgi:hypothetical protein
MKTSFLTFILFLNMLYHGGNIAEYEFTYNKNKIYMKFKIDKSELDALNLSVYCKDFINKSLCINNYLNKNLIVKINDKLVQFTLENSFIENHHLVINLSGSNYYTKINKISVINNCFYAQNVYFKNRLIFNFNNLNKSYILNKNNNTLNLNLQ